jgi:dTDP-4-amino-4,6-dideoxygalactose transaminase
MILPILYYFIISFYSVRKLFFIAFSLFTFMQVLFTFDNTNYRPKERLPVAKELGETSLMFLVHPTLTEEEIKLTCDVITEVMHLAAKPD